MIIGPSKKKKSMYLESIGGGGEMGGVKRCL